MGGDNHLLKAIAGISVLLESSCSELIERLRKDFEAFPEPTLRGVAPALRVRAELGARPSEMPDESRSYRLSRNCRSLNLDAVRWNDYWGEAWVRYDFAKNEALVVSEKLDRLHEISYLIALSRAGKALDLGGRHRIHAMALAHQGRVLVLSMPMKGGKTTSFLRMLDAEASLQIVSDDSPLVDSTGRVSSFPLRLGLDPENARAHAEMSWLSWDRSYELERMRYGKKVLLPISSLGRAVFDGSSHSVILLKGVRTGEREPRLVRSGAMNLVPVVFSNLVIGVGLPMMREYFFENSSWDFATCMRIFFNRLKAAVALLKSADKYRIFLGTDHQANARMLLDLLMGDQGTSVCPE